ncbi:ATP-dependent RNA helicase DDX51 [Cherax quadricarinatus]|nr:ATP-dependent RNA helicase DDX51-like [Cherax quadricarinatus]XP_053646722.1 ATP-dependent RNA helicase DDX51-like [Cherax quadricarinatus]
MAWDSGSTPGRYWGPGSVGNRGVLGSPDSTSQASIILARLNARARAIKAGKSPLANKLQSEAQREGTNNESLEKDKVTSYKSIKEHVSTKSFREEEDQAESSVKPDITSKNEVVSACEEISSEEHSKRKKHKRSKENKNIGEEDKIFENDISTFVNDENPTNNMVSESPKKKKKSRKVKDDDSKEIEHTNYHDTINDTEQGVDEDLVRKKKRKKRVNEVGENGQIEKVNCLSSEHTQEDIKKKNEICDVINEEDQVDRSISVQEAQKMLENESISKSPKKKKKRKNNESAEEFTLGKDSNTNKLEIEDTCELVNEEDQVDRGISVQEAQKMLENESESPKKKKKRRINESVEEFTSDKDSSTKKLEIEDMCDLVNKKKRKKTKQEPEDIESHIEGEVSKLGVNSDESREAVHSENRRENEALQVEKSTDSKILKSELDVSNFSEKSPARKMKEKKMKKKQVKAEKQGIGMKCRKIRGFTLLKKAETTTKKELHRTLPQWLAQPTVISRDLHADSTSITSVQGLNESLKKILEEQKIEKFFPVQNAVIPEILASASSLSMRYRPRDICVSAPTGSGKTLAYVLPIIQALTGRTVPRIQALVILPVQELAIQIYKVFLTYIKASNLKVGLAVGQKTFKKEQEALVCEDCCGNHSHNDILVATPGKLADHLRFTKGINLSSLRYLVYDEADHLLSAEGGDWVKRIEQSIREHEALSENVLINGFQGSGIIQFPRVPLHRLLFSATLSHDPELLQNVPLYRPKLITACSSESGKIQRSSVSTMVGQYTRPAELKEEYVVMEESVKPLVLHYLLTSKSWRRVLIFTNSVEATHKLGVLLAALSEDLKIAEFSSTQMNKRQQIVSQFSSGKIDVLVSSDAMARGLDIPDIEHVVSYEVPSLSTYIHRIGRTARAGKPGTALSLVTNDTMHDFKTVLSNTGNVATRLVISTEELEPYEFLYVNALAKMKEIFLHEKLEQRKQLEESISRPQGNKRQLKFKGKNQTDRGVKNFTKRLHNFRKPNRVR